MSVPSGPMSRPEGEHIVHFVAPLVCAIDVAQYVKKYGRKPTLEEVQNYLEDAILQVPFDDRENPIQLESTEVVVDRFMPMTTEQVDRHYQ